MVTGYSHRGEGNARILIGPLLLFIIPKFARVLPIILIESNEEWLTVQKSAY